MPGDSSAITPWPDPVLDVLGHDPRSWYAETFWLPTLGPTALLLMRHLADRFERRTRAASTLPVADTAAALGLGPRDGEQSPLMRSLAPAPAVRARARARRPEVIAVRRTLPPVHRRHVRRLPARCRRATPSGSSGQTANDGLDARAPPRPPRRAHAARAGRAVRHRRARAAPRRLPSRARARSRALGRRTAHDHDHRRATPPTA